VRKRFIFQIPSSVVDDDRQRPIPRSDADARYELPNDVSGAAREKLLLPANLLIFSAKLDERLSWAMQSHTAAVSPCLAAPVGFEKQKIGRGKQAPP
jgi:hypothetical protein